MIKFVTALVISFTFLITTASATSTVVINGLPSTLAVGDTVIATASGGIAPYTWSTNQPAHIQVDSVSATQARIIVLLPHPSVTIYANDVIIESGYVPISTHAFKVRIPDISFTYGDTAAVPIYYTDRSTPFTFLAADISLPYDTTVFQYIGFEQSSTLTDTMTVIANQVSDTIKIGIAASVPVTSAVDAVFIKLKFISKDTVVAPVSRQLHFTKFEANEVFTAAFIDGSLTVNPIPNYPPVFTAAAANDTIDENTTYNFIFAATDSNSHPVRFFLTLNPAPANEASIDSITGSFSFTPSFTGAGEYLFEVTANDGNGGTTPHQFTIVVNNVNLSPVITTAIPDTIYLPENILFALDIDATDADGEPLKYYVIDPPPGMTIDSLTGEVAWTPTYTQAGIYNPTFKVTDSLGGYDTKYVVMVVINVNRFPVLTSVMPDTTISEGELLTFQYAAVDPDNDSLTFYLLSPIPGMTVSLSGLFQWQPNSFQSGIDTVIIMVSDGSSALLDSAVITILNVNAPPVFLSTLADTAIARFDTLRFTYSAFDADSQQLNFSFISAPPNAVISQSGALEWAPPANATGEYLFVVQVTDSVAIIIDTALVRVYRFGDVSGNGAISSFDAGLILRDQVAAIVLSPIQLRVANVSGDSTVSPLDASQILQFVVGLIDTFQGGLGKRSAVQAQLSAFSFAIVPSMTTGEYDLNVTVNKPSNVYGLTMSIGFDTAVVSPKSIKQTTLTDSMLMFTHFPSGNANVSLAGTKPMNTPGDIVRFTFALKQQQISNEAAVFTMKKFVLNETDHTNDIKGITLNVQTSNSAPGEFRLGQNYPNPFNPVTTIAYQLASESNVIITVYNLLGQAVKTLVHAPQSAGYYTVAWNGTDGNNKTVSSGVYLYKIIAQANGKNSFVNTKKMLLLK